MSAGRTVRACLLASLTTLTSLASLASLATMTVLTSLAMVCIATTGCDMTSGGSAAGSAAAAESEPAARSSGPQASAPLATPAATPATTVATVATQTAPQAATPAAGQEPGGFSNTISPRPPVHLTAQQVAELDGLVAELRTSQGTVVIDFLPEKAPGHVQNFVDLARRGFYDGTQFHRVIPGLFIQGGDPTGTGDGGPGYFIPAEFNDEPHVRGTVSMARLRHPDSAGSQFFICLATLPYLDGGYTAFGHVVSGDEVLGRIEKLGRATPQGTPTETITLEKVLIRPRSPSERPTASRQP